MSSVTHGATPYYFVPGPSRHPAMAALGLFFVILGASQWINGAEWGKYSLAAGMVGWLFCCTNGSVMPWRKAKAASTGTKLTCRTVGA